MEYLYPLGSNGRENFRSELNQIEHCRTVEKLFLMVKNYNLNMFSTLAIFQKKEDCTMKVENNVCICQNEGAV
jgi:hypothetical protein